ncbi:hypothetical protein NM208_g4430 [Fusarium decemcellulare]|uniref:Uncharacterized protein n=1 Tax=Fusarium decemcellulare TaxID=57161 RepID=A0ACC1SL49_9HYPO|nr:hypothetical protein NM208_g4430 [Fusarium decemcellulare]
MMLQRFLAAVCLCAASAQADDFLIPNLPWTPSSPSDSPFTAVGTRVVCATISGTSSRNVTTTTSTFTRTSTTSIIATVAPSTTVTPATVTVTNTRTAYTTTTTTADTKTYTRTTYSTSTTTRTYTETTVSTSTETTTRTRTRTETTTSTVAPSAGFIAVANESSYLDGMGLVRRSFGPGPVRMRIEPRTPQSKTPKSKTARVDPRPTLIKTPGARQRTSKSDPTQYPRKVYCVTGLTEFISTTVSTTTGSTSTITGCTPITTTISTSTSTITWTDAPESTTSTETITKTWYDYTTTTDTKTKTWTSTTTTTTNTTATATVYPACGPDNLVGLTPAGDSINAISYLNGASVLGAYTPYDCCVSCLLDTACGASAWEDTKSCIHYAYGGGSEVCDPKEVIGTFSHVKGDGPGGFVVSNSNCGMIVPEEEWD